MLVFGIIMLAIGIIALIIAGISQNDGLGISSVIFLSIGIVSLAIYFSEREEINSFNRNYPIEKKYEFYKIYTEDNKQEYVIDPEFSNGMIIVKDKIFTKYSGYKKLTREEAVGHYK